MKDELVLINEDLEKEFCNHKFGRVKEEGFIYSICKECKFKKVGFKEAEDEK